MKIVTVSGILPIPDLIKENDIIFQIYDHLTERYPQNDVEFIRTIPYSNFFLSLLKDKWKAYHEAIKKNEYVDRGYNITVFPHFIFKSEENLYSFLTKITYYQNFFKVQKFADADIIHAHRIFSEGPLAYKMAQRFSKPYAITVRKETNYFNNSYAEQRANKILENASFITTPSPNSYAFLNKRFPEKIHFIPHGVEQRFFTEKKVKTSRPVRILTVSNLLELKNIENVIVALEELKGDFDFKYQIVGDGPHRKVIEDYIQKYEMAEHVEMSAHIPHQEIQNVYAKSDIFVMVSYPETFGRVYFEAMAAGVPVICAKNSGIHGFFEEGVSGFSIDHKNTPALRSILRKLINDRDLRIDVGNKGKDLVSNYSWSTVAKKYNDLYQKAIQNHLDA